MPVPSGQPLQQVVMAPRYRVTLESEELVALTPTVQKSDKVFTKACALLLCDRGTGGPDPRWIFAKTTKALRVSSRTIEHLRRRCVEEGLEAAPRCKPRGATFDGKFQVRLIAPACSPAPEGRARWTVRLLAEKAVELGMARCVSPMTAHSAEGECGSCERHVGCSAGLCATVLIVLIRSGPWSAWMRPTSS